MKRPLRKEFQKPFGLDPKLTTIDRNSYIIALNKYIDFLEAKLNITRIKNAK